MKKGQGQTRVARTSFQVLTVFLVAWGSVFGQDAPPASPCDSDSFEVQFRAVCPTNPSDLPIIYEESAHPTMVIRIDNDRKPNSDAVFAAFGPNPYAGVDNVTTLFSSAVNEAAIFSENGRKKVQLFYGNRNAHGFKNIVFTVCDDPKGKCVSADKKILSAREIRFSSCNVPALVTIPVYAGCR